MTKKAGKRTIEKFVLVTGGTGFIGSHLVERLLGQGRRVKVLALEEPFEDIEKENEDFLVKKGAVIVRGDLLDPKTLPKALEDVDVVYHLAAISRPMKILNKAYYDTNVEGTRNLLRVCKDRKLKRFIHTSTVSILGLSPDGRALKEDDYQYDDLEYGRSKRQSEFVALEYYFRHKIPVTVIRPCLVYGPRCQVRLIMFKFVKLGLFPIFGRGKTKIEFAYVDNVVDAMMLVEKASENKVLGEVFNITDGRSYEIGEVLDAIAEALEVNPPRLKIPVKLGYFMGWAMEQFSKVANVHPPFSRGTAKWMSKDINVYDCTKAIEVLGYSPSVDLKEGVRRTVAWYEERGDL